MDFDDFGLGNNERNSMFELSGTEKSQKDRKTRNIGRKTNPNFPKCAKILKSWFSKIRFLILVPFNKVAVSNQTIWINLKIGRRGASGGREGEGEKETTKRS